MEHAEATASHATERYLLNEMSDSERDAFETHYFDCLECAADVREAAKMMAAGRELARDGARRDRTDPERTNVVPIRPKGGWKGWVPQAAAASIISLFAGWYGAVQTVTPRLAAIEPVRVIDHEVGYERGDAASIVIGKTEEAVLHVNGIHHEQADSYILSITDANGKVHFTVPVSRTEALEAYPLTIRGRELPRGSYRVVIERVTGGNRVPITKADEAAAFTVGER